MDVNQFHDWTFDALPGQAVEYHRGYLAKDREPSKAMSQFDREKVRDLGEVADYAWAAAKAGVVRLVQRRLGDMRYSYLAVRRRMRLP